MSEYKIKYNGQYIEVSKEVYEFHKRSERKIRYMEKDIKREHIKVGSDKVTIIRSREDSFERLVGTGVEFADSSDNTEEAASRKALVDKLLSGLTDSERELVQLIFYMGMTEKQVAEKKNINQSTVSRKLSKVLEKMKNMLKE